MLTCPSPTVSYLMDSDGFWRQSGYWVTDFSVAKHHSQAYEVDQRQDNVVVDGDAVDGAHGAAHVEVGSRAAAGLVELQVDSLVVDSALVDTLDRLDSLAVDRLDSELVALVVEHKDLWERRGHGVVEHMGRELVVVRRGHEVVGHMDHAVEVHMDHEHRGLVVVEHMDPAVAWHKDLVHTEVVGMLLSQVDSLEVDKPALGVDNWAPQADSLEVDILEARSLEDTSARSQAQLN